MTCVVADDEPTNLLLFRGYFRSLPVVFVGCSNGAQALEAWRVHRPELVLLDMKMPDFHGVEIAKTIRSEDPGHRCFLVAMSANRPADAGVDLASGLWDAFLEKPISRQTLMNFLSKHLGIVDEPPSSP